MKTKLGVIFICIIVLIFIMGLCAATDAPIDENTDTKAQLWNQFVIVDRQFSFLHGTLYTVYDKDSKAMYYYTYGRYDKNLVAIYNEDGTIKYYKGELENE